MEYKARAAAAELKLAESTECSVCMGHKIHVLIPCNHVCVCEQCAANIMASSKQCPVERWGAGVETQKNVRGEVGGWGRVPYNEPYAPLLSTIYDGA